MSRLLKIFNEHKFCAEGDQNFNSFVYEVIPCLLPSRLHVKAQLPILKVFTESKIGLGNPFVDGIRAALVQAGMYKVGLEIFEEVDARFYHIF